MPALLPSMDPLLLTSLVRRLMYRRQLPFAALLVAALAVLSMRPAGALTITLDYTYDSFFNSTPAAKSAIEAAANDLGDAVTTALAPLTTNVWTGNYGSTTSTYTYSATFPNPATGSEVQISSPRASTDAIRVYVGGRALPGGTLGIGGPQGGGLSVGLIGFPNEYNNAVAIGAANATAGATRGGGPVISTLAGSIASANYNVDFGLAYGALAFDYDTNNDNVIDSPAQLAASWHYDHTTPVAAGKNDLYSVALHELMHVLGIGASSSWVSKASGSNWSGSEVVSLLGSGTGVLTADSSHISSGRMSTRISDGAPQEAAMDPTLTVGTRKELTALDLAFLRDIGHTTITPTLPGDFNHNGDVNSADLAVWRSAYGVNANADANGDLQSSGADFLIWQRAAANSTPTIAAVPEPAGFALIVVAAGAWFARRLHQR